MTDEQHDTRGQRGRHQRGELARELERLVRELDESPEANYPVTSHEALASDEPDDEPDNEPEAGHRDATDVTEEVARLQEDIHYLTDALLSVRSDLLNAMVRTEQQIQQEITLMEKRFRGDLSLIRDQLAANDVRSRHSRPQSSREADE